MLIKSHSGVRWATSGGSGDRFGHVTPFLHSDGGKATVFFGAAGRKSWDANAIASAPVLLPE